MSLKHHPAVVRGFSIVHRARMVEQPARFALHELRRDLLLDEAGYRTQEIDNVPLGAGMLWAWRQPRVSSS